MNEEIRRELNCEVHGSAFSTYICDHLFASPNQKWFSGAVSDSDPWPDAWCEQCNELFDQQGEWNDKNSGGLKARVLCHHCYQVHRPKESD
jgi:hypothetical protein